MAGNVSWKWARKSPSSKRKNISKQSSPANKDPPPALHKHVSDVHPSHLVPREKAIELKSASSDLTSHLFSTSQ
jgi:hypothetical protein